MTNEKQRDHWDGEGGSHWAAQKARYDAMLAPYGQRVVAAAAPQPRERFIDVGCGNGAVSLAIAKLVDPGGEVLGVDLSGPMLEVARQRAIDAGRVEARFEQADAQVHPFEEASFDAVVSRFGVMFFDDPAAAFANLGRALRPGGRLAFVCWQEMTANEWIMVPAMAALQHVPMPEMGEPGAPGPFAFADPDRVTSILKGAGFSEIKLDEVNETQVIGPDADDVTEFFRKSEFTKVLLGDASPDTVEAVFGSIREALVERQEANGVVLGGVAWLVTATRP